MTKRIFAVLVALVLMFTACISASALSGYVTDTDGILSSDEKSKLEAKVNETSEKYDCQVGILTIKSLNGLSAEQYAEKCELAGDGILLLVCADSRDYYLRTEGYAQKAFTKAGLDYVSNEIKTHLSDEEYYKAFDEFADLCDDFLKQAETGTPYDTGNLPVKFSISWVIWAVVIGVVIAFIAVLIMKGQLKSVRYEPAAKNYLVDGSFNLTLSRDIFLYSTVKRVAKPKQNSSSGSGSGNSNGTGGKF